MLKKLLIGSLMLGLAGCSGGSGGGQAPIPPPPNVSTFGVMLTQIQLTRAADGAAVRVNGLPLNSNITVILTN